MGPDLVFVRPEQVEPNPRQPRSEMDPDALLELANSLREVGLLQPVLVRPAPGTTERFQLIAGERRLRASQMAGLTRIPAIVRQTPDSEMLREALLENLQRSDLNVLEEAAALAGLLEDSGCTHDELARMVGKSRPYISNSLRLLRLPPAVARRVAAGVISGGHARALLALPDEQSMIELASRIVAEGLSVRAVEEIVALGADESPPVVRRRRSGGARSTAGLESFAEGLSQKLDTRVAVTMGQNHRGRVTIEFSGVPDLERIVSLLNAREDAGPEPFAIRTE